MLLENGQQFDHESPLKLKKECKRTCTGMQRTGVRMRRTGVRKQRTGVRMQESV